MTACKSFFALAAWVAFMLPLGSAAQTQTVALTTQKAVGQNLTLVVNSAARVSIDWGDGQPVQAATDTVQGTLAAQTITITGPAEWSTLACEGQSITAADVSKAPYLASLYLANNALTEVNLAACTGLLDLDLSHNELSAISLSKNTKLLTLNLAYNHLSSINIFQQAALQELNLAHNDLSSLTFYRNNAALESVNCAGNRLSKLSLIYLSGLRSLFCWNNELQSLSFGSRDSLVEALWCDSNRIEKLDLSDCGKLKQLSATHNLLTSITYPDAAGKTDYTLLSVQDNRLSFPQLLPRQSVKQYAVNYTYAPQAPIRVAARLPIDSALSLAEYRYNVNGKYLGVTLNAYTQTDSTALLSGTDYSVSAGTIRFKRSVEDSVYVTLQNTSFPGLVQATTNFHVGHAVGIHAAGKASGVLQVMVADHVLTLTAPSAQTVTIYAADGALVWRGRVAGSVTVHLPRGVYVVNGKKYVL